MGREGDGGRERRRESEMRRVSVEAAILMRGERGSPMTFSCFPTSSTEGQYDLIRAVLVLLHSDRCLYFMTPK